MDRTIVRHKKMWRYIVRQIDGMLMGTTKPKLLSQIKDEYLVKFKYEEFRIGPINGCFLCEKYLSRGVFPDDDCPGCPLVSVFSHSCFPYDSRYQKMYDWLHHAFKAANNPEDVHDRYEIVLMLKMARKIAIKIRDI